MKFPLVPSVVATALVTLSPLTGGVVALAADCSIGDPSPGDPGALVVEWVMGVDESAPPSLDIYVPDREGLTVRSRRTSAPT